MHYAYILQSIPHPERFYHGSTSDLKKRLETHNNGGNVSTKPHRPWKLVWYAGFLSKQQALDFEGYLKTASGFQKNKGPLLWRLEDPPLIGGGTMADEETQRCP